MGSFKIRKILLLDGVDAICAAKLEAVGLEVTSKPKLSKDDLMKEIQNYDGVVVRSATQITAEVLAAGTRLQMVGRAGVGTDNIDVDAATRRGVLVMNTPTGNTISAAEHTCALICSLGRCLPQACESLKGGVWDRKKFMGNELYGKTLAIIGLGRIGREVAHRMQAFNMTCIGYDPFVSAAAAAEWTIEALPLEEIWPRADYITVHTPLLPHTRNLLGEEVLMTKCKPGVKVVNVARGGIVDEAALLRALEAGRCGGAGLDVFTTEPPTDYALCRHPKVVCTPHLGASTFEAQERVAEELADQMVSAVSGGPVAGLVNGGALATANSSDAQPWLALASALGQVAEVVVSGPLTSVTLVPTGALANKNLANALCSAVLAGLLKKSSSGTANLINSCVLAQDLNISCEILPPSDEQKPILPSGVDNGLLVAVSGANSSVKLVGSSANGQPLLYSVNDSSWPIAVPLSRSLVLYRSLAASSPLPAIAATLVKGGLLSLASSAEGLWHVATLDSPVTELDAKVQDVEYVGQVSL